MTVSWHPDKLHPVTAARDDAAGGDVAVGKRTRVDPLVSEVARDDGRPVPRAAAASSAGPAARRPTIADLFPGSAVHAAAARGLEGPATPLPFAAQIQASFGPRHDVAAIQAHVGDTASEAASAMGASAYATGNHAVFAGAPQLHTAAHEAAHVIQQRAGVALAGGIGTAGDAHEQHADAVADRVVAGASAEDLLDRYREGPGPGAGAVQHKLSAEAVRAIAPAPGPTQAPGPSSLSVEQVLAYLARQLPTAIPTAETRRRIQAVLDDAREHGVDELFGVYRATTRPPVRGPQSHRPAVRPGPSEGDPFGRGVIPPRVATTSTASPRPAQPAPLLDEPIAASPHLAAPLTPAQPPRPGVATPTRPTSPPLFPDLSDGDPSGVDLPPPAAPTRPAPAAPLLDEPVAASPHLAAPLTPAQPPRPGVAPAARPDPSPASRPASPDAARAPAPPAPTALGAMALDLQRMLDRGNGPGVIDLLLRLDPAERARLAGEYAAQAMDRLDWSSLAEQIAQHLPPNHRAYALYLLHGPAPEAPAKDVEVADWGQTLVSADLGTGRVSVHAHPAFGFGMPSSAEQGPQAASSAFAMRYEGGQASEARWLQFASRHIVVKSAGAENELSIEARIRDFTGMEKPLTTDPGAPSRMLDPSNLLAHPFYDTHPRTPKLRDDRSTTLLDRPGGVVGEMLAFSKQPEPPPLAAEELQGDRATLMQQIRDGSESNRQAGLEFVAQIERLIPATASWCRALSSRASW